MKKLTYGNGRLQTQKGTTGEGLKCITIKELKEAQPIGATPAEWDKEVNEDSLDVILEFKNIEGARVLQDMLNSMICDWVDEEAEVI